MGRFNRERVGDFVATEMFGDDPDIDLDDLDDLGGIGGGADVDDLGDLDASDLGDLDGGFEADVDIDPDIDASLIGDVDLGSAWMLPAGAGLGILGGLGLGAGIATAGMRSERKRKTRDLRKDQRIAERRARRDGLEGLTPASLAKLGTEQSGTAALADHRYGGCYGRVPPGGRSPAEFGRLEAEVDAVLDDDDLDQ